MATKLLIQGAPGVGKTTLVRRVLEAKVPLAGGFVTEEVRDGTRRVGFQVEDVATGETAVLARTGRAGGPRIGNYGVDLASFERVGVAALRRAMARPGCLVIDEIGKMELTSGAFREAVESILDADRDVLATIPARRHPFIERLRVKGDVEVVRVSRANRDALVKQLAARLGGEAGQGPWQAGTQTE